MNHTFGRVAAHCGLRLSYYTTIALLATAFLILTMTSYRTPSPLYILFVAAVAPSVIKGVLQGNGKQKRANTEAFPLFCKKYKYDAVLYQSMNISYLLLFILFAAWQISYSRSFSQPVLTYKLPSLLAAVSLCTRILGTVGYRLYFRLFPLKAMR